MKRSHAADAAQSAASHKRQHSASTSPSRTAASHSEPSHSKQQHSAPRHSQHYTQDTASSRPIHSHSTDRQHSTRHSKQQRAHDSTSHAHSAKQHYIHPSTVAAHHSSAERYTHHNWQETTRRLQQHLRPTTPPAHTDSDLQVAHHNTDHTQRHTAHHTQHSRKRKADQLSTFTPTRNALPPRTPLTPAESPELHEYLTAYRSFTSAHSSPVADGTEQSERKHSTLLSPSIPRSMPARHLTWHNHTPLSPPIQQSLLRWLLPSGLFGPLLLYDNLINTYCNEYKLQLQLHRKRGNAPTALPYLNYPQLCSLRGWFLTDRTMFAHGKIQRSARQIAAQYANNRSMVELARQYNTPPGALSRLILKEQRVSKEEIKNYIRDPLTCPNARDRAELQRAKLCDVISWTDEQQLIAATAFEAQVESFFAERGISFVTQNTLVSEQTEKFGAAISTPDIVFTEPVYINGQLVQWIDAKNYYLSDSSLLVKNTLKQMKRYQEQYGSGAIVTRLGHSAGFVQKLGSVVTVLDAMSVIPYTPEPLISPEITAKFEQHPDLLAVMSRNAAKIMALEQPGVSAPHVLIECSMTQEVRGIAHSAPVTTSTTRALTPEKLDPSLHSPPISPELKSASAASSQRSTANGKNSKAKSPSHIDSTDSPSLASLTSVRSLPAQLLGLISESDSDSDSPSFVAEEDDDDSSSQQSTPPPLKKRKVNGGD